MTTRVDWQANLTVTLTPDSDSENATGVEQTIGISDGRDYLDATTTPVVDSYYYDSGELAGGVITIDLSSLTDERGDAMDWSNKTIQGIMIKVPTSNTDGINLKPKAGDNPYPIVGQAEGGYGSMCCAIGACVAMVLLEKNAQAVDATHKNIQLGSNDADADYEILLVAGTNA